MDALVTTEWLANELGANDLRVVDATYFGSPNGKPNSSWGNVEVDYLPWLNVKLGLQYTAYTKFNGASKNYDGNGRNASDNNMIFGYVWFAY